MSGGPVDLPMADLVTDRAGLVLADRPLVALSRALADTAARCAGAGLQLQLVTPSRTRLTWALAELLDTGGACWVVQDATGPATDGLRCTPLGWDGASFTPAGTTVAPAAPGSGGGTVVDVTVLHEPRADLRLGGPLEDALAALTGEAPTGWGVAEPAASRWDRDALTGLCRERSPGRTVLVAVGPHDPEAGRGSTATLTVRRVPAGLLERVRLFAGSAGPAPGPVLDSLAERLSAYEVRTALVGLRPGSSDGTVAAGAGRAVLPAGVLVGAEGLADRGATLAAAGDTVLMGVPGRRSGWVRLDPGDPQASRRRLSQLLPGGDG